MRKSLFESLLSTRSIQDGSSCRLLSDAILSRFIFHYEERCLPERNPEVVR
jgi:hypothetical protein